VLDTALHLTALRAAGERQDVRMFTSMEHWMRSLTFALVSISAVLLVSSCAMIDSYTGEDVNKPVRENGVPASAEVLEIWDTGVRLNDNPVVGFRLLVTLDDGTSYEAETKNVVSVVHIPQVQPGAILPVKVDPQNHELVALEIYERRE